MIGSPYKIMWLLAMFDLPVTDPEKLKEYRRFHKFLEKDGFTMMQYSVYIRHCASEENAQVHFDRVKCALPPDGEVRILAITDKQFGRMKVFWGKVRKPPDPTPCQLELF